MKAVMVSGLYYPNVFGGTEKVVQNLAEALAAHGHQIVVATLSRGRVREIAEVNGVRVYYLPLKNIYFPGRPASRNVVSKLLWHALDTYNPVMAEELASVLEEERPDVVNSHNIGGFSALAWRAVKARGLPLVNSTHGVNLLCPWFLSRAGKACSSHCTACRMYAYPRILLSRHVDVLTGVSQYVVDEYRRHGAFRNAESMVIYNACAAPLDLGVPRHLHKKALRFGFLGRLHPSKGVGLLIQSFLCLASGEAELLIAGQGAPDYERELRALAGGHPGVRWLGHVEPTSLLRYVDVLVVPSLVRDTAPLSVQEGMAHGLPIIGSCRGGIPELMGAGAGWVFEPDEPGALTQAMERAINACTELRAMGDRALQRARRFSMGTMVDGYLKAYSRAIERKRENETEQ